MSLFKRTSRNGESFVWHVKYRDASNKIKRVSTRTSNKTIAQRTERVNNFETLNVRV